MRRFYFRAPCWANGKGAGFTRSFWIGDPARSGPILRAVAQSIPGGFPATHWSLVLTAGSGSSTKLSHGIVIVVP